MPYYTRNMVRFMRRNEHGRLVPLETPEEDKRRTSKTAISVRESKQNLVGNVRKRESKTYIKAGKSSQNLAEIPKNLKKSQEKKEEIKLPQNELKSVQKDHPPSPEYQTGAPLKRTRSSVRRLQVCSLQRIGPIRPGREQDQKVLRITPSWVDIEAIDAMKNLDTRSGTRLKVESLEDMKYDRKRLQFQQNMLRLMVDKIRKLDGPIPIVKLDDKIRIDWDSRCVNIHSSYSDYYKTRHTKMGKDEIITKTVQCYKEMIKNPLYPQILRHLGKKHPYIVQTWEIFNSDDMLIVVQEYAAKGNLNQYLQNCNVVNEESINTWARQMFNAMDYLGDMAICHRNLMPKYILFSQRNNDIKLTGFYNSIIYWDPVDNDIEAQPCKALSTRRKDAPDYQAPEVYGNNDYEYFDPVQADMWSLGAILFYALTKTYPFDFRINNPKIEEEIQKKISELTGIGEECRQFYSEILTTNVARRLNFDKLYKHDFFVKIKFRKPSLMGLQVPDSRGSK